MNNAPIEEWHERVPRQQRLPIMAGLLMVMLLASLDQTIVSTALPKVISDLKGFDRYSWVATAYLLTATVTVPLYGKLSDLYGRKRILLFGVVVFLLGSATSGAAQSMNELILARGFQGIGAGALMPVVIATMGDLFSPRERGRVQGVTGAVFGFSAIIGPSLGGWITDHFSWRWVFYVNLPVGIAAMIVLVVLMPSLRFTKSQQRVDYVGATLLIAGLVPLLLAFTWAGSTYAWGSVQTIGLFAWSIAALTVFVIVELRVVQPIIEPRLFRNSIYLVSIAVTFLIGAAMFGGIFYIPLFIQGIIGSSATTSGTVITPLMVTAIVGSVISGQLLSRWDRYRLLALGGLLLMTVGVLLLLRLGVNSHYGDVLVAMIVMGAGLGFGMAMYTVIVQNSVPQSEIGQVTSGLTLFRQLGGTIGLAVMGSFLTSRFSTEFNVGLSASLRRHIPPATLGQIRNPQVLISAQSQAALHQFFSRFGAQGPAMYTEFQNTIKLALSNALHDVFLLNLITMVAATIIVLFLREIPLRARATEPGESSRDQAPIIESIPTAQTAPGESQRRRA
ncbi:MAG: MDR family MFS transporter [Chloroflexota bacterium]